MTSSATGTVPPSPTITVTEPVTHSTAWETTEGRTRKDLEHDKVLSLRRHRATDMVKWFLGGMPNIFT